MASAPRVDFSSAMATTVVKTACALLTSERMASWQVDALSVEAAWTRMYSTPYAGQTRAAPTLALVKALLMAHDEAPDPVFLAEPRRTSWRNATGRNSDAATVATAGTATVVVAAKIVGVATTTTTAGVTAVVEAGEAHRVLVWLRAPPRGQLWSNNRGSWPQLWRRQRRAEEWRERTFSVGRLVNLLQLVFVLEHGPQ